MVMSPVLTGSPLSKNAVTRYVPGGTMGGQIRHAPALWGVKSGMARFRGCRWTNGGVRLPPLGEIAGVFPLMKLGLRAHKRHSVATAVLRV